MNKASTLPTPPRAEQRPFSYDRHGVTIEDPWAWLRDPGYPDVRDEEVLAYLKAENDYFEAAMAPHKPSPISPTGDFPNDSPTRIMAIQECLNLKSVISNLQSQISLPPIDTHPLP